jgi:hypothetical protein
VNEQLWDKLTDGAGDGVDPSSFRYPMVVTLDVTVFHIVGFPEEINVAAALAIGLLFTF